MEKTQRFLVAYSATVTLVFALTVFAGFLKKATLIDELNVHRINVVEKDGKLRMVIANHSRLPGVIVHGKEQPPEDRPQAGMIFYNDEASEVGGLIFGGYQDSKGEIHDSGGSLSFDRYGASQTIQLMGVDDKDYKFSGLKVFDSQPGKQIQQRIRLGRGNEGIATLALLDGQGKERLVLQVSAEGRTTISALDANGKVTKTLLSTETP